MIEGVGPEKGRPGGAPSAEAGLSVADLFGILWDALADLLGTAATAALLKRAALRAAPRSPHLAGLLIRREELVYTYVCPVGWSAKGGAPEAALRALIAELRPLLVEMTGQLVIQHLQQFVELRERDLLGPREERK